MDKRVNLKILLGVSLLAFSLVFICSVDAMEVPDIKAGIQYQFNEETISPTVGFEVYELDIGKFVPWVNHFDVSLDLGAADDVPFATLQWIIFPVVELSIGPFFGRNLEEDEWEYGIQGSIIKF